MIERMELSEEQRLIALAQQSGREAVEELLAAHRSLICTLAKRLHMSASIEEELIQAGYTGFLKALGKFKADMQVRLSTYAFPWIVGEMKSLMRTLELQRADQSFEEIESVYEDKQAEEWMETEAFVCSFDLKRSIEKLDREEQILIYLRYYRDKTQKETALILKKSQSQISKTEARILNLLRRELS